MKQRTIVEKKEALARAMLVRKNGGTLQQAADEAETPLSTLQHWMKYGIDAATQGRPIKATRKIVRDEIERALEPIKDALGIVDDEVEARDE